MNYFAIEHGGNYYDHVVLKDSDGHPVFTDYLDMDYETMKYSTDLEDFVCAVMEAADEDGGADQTVITLVGEDGVFIWGIIIGYDEDDMLRYVLVDWKKDGKNYSYEP